MAIINFPPTAGEPTDGSFTYTFDGVLYSWTGSYWTANTQSGFDNRYVEVAGDTMTGALNVPAGASGTQAPQVQEVVQKSGDTMTGDLLVGSDITIESLTGKGEFRNLSAKGDGSVGQVAGVYVGPTDIQDGDLPGFRVLGDLGLGSGDRSAALLLNSTGNGRLNAMLSLASTNSTPRFYFAGDDGAFRSIIDYKNAYSNNGTVVGTQTSDERLKQNIVDYTSGLDVVLQLEPKQYEYIQSPETRHAGFIAQQVQGLIPEAVYSTNELKGRDPNPYLAMTYVEIIPALVNSIKECNASIEALKAEVQSLKGGNN